MGRPLQGACEAHGLGGVRGPEKEDKHPEVAGYRDGMLKKSFWEEQWHMFRQCSACQRWSYINKGNELRMNPGCRGCQAPGCTANRKGGKKWLLKSLEAQKPGLYKDHLVEMGNIQEEP